MKEMDMFYLQASARKQNVITTASLPKVSSPFARGGSPPASVRAQRHKKSEKNKTTEIPGGFASRGQLEIRAMYSSKHNPLSWMIFA